MNTKTPMQTVKHFTTLLKELTGDNFTQIALNSSAAKHNPFKHGWPGGDGYSRGVTSDFILIFKEKDGHASFGFVFDYINKQPDEWTIKATYKPVGLDYKSWEYQEDEKDVLNHNIVSSRPFSIYEFKSVSKLFIKDIKNNPSVDNIISTLKTHFIKKEDEIDMNDLAEYTFLEISKKLESKITAVDDLADLTMNTTISIDKARQDSRKLLNKTPEYIRAEAIRNELKQLERVIAKQHKDILNKKNVTKLENEHSSSLKLFSAKKLDLRRSISDEVDKLPTHIKAMVLKKFK